MAASANGTYSAAIIGATGYTGAELLRLLASHPSINATIATARSLAGQPVRETYPHIQTEMVFSELDAKRIAQECDLAFTCLPHAQSAPIVLELQQAGVQHIVDLSADFRYDDAALYEKTYGIAAASLGESVPYGLPEWNRSALAGAEVVAAPGCYVTASLLALLPVWKSDIALQGPVIIDAKSGVSGAGRSATQANLLAELANDFRPYKTDGHRHESEIRHRLNTLGNARENTVVFSPHLLPIPRGILASCYLQVPASQHGAIQASLAATYKDEPFVRVLQAGEPIRVKAVTGTNQVLLQAVSRPEENVVVILATLDNLCKGASGQALQCANLMLGLPETSGLQTTAVYP